MRRALLSAIGVSLGLFGLLFGIYLLVGWHAASVGAAIVVAASLGLAIVMLRDPSAPTRDAIPLGDVVVVMGLQAGLVVLAVLLTERFNAIWIVLIAIAAFPVGAKIYIDRRIERSSGRDDWSDH